jgi:hypothetical protein
LELSDHLKNQTQLFARQLLSKVLLPPFPYSQQLEEIVSKLAYILDLMAFDQPSPHLFLGLRQIGKIYDFTVGKLFFDTMAAWQNHRKCAKSYDK